jgi:hypothetical protein
MPEDKVSVDESEIAPAEDLLARMKRIEAGEFWPSDQEPLAAAPTPLTREEANALRGEFFKLVAATPRPRCLATITPACREPTTDCHTLQRSGALALLDDGTGHVLVSHVETTLPPSVGFKREGVRKATTFRGLCNKHDSELFRSIDQKLLPPSEEQLFALSYRAVLYKLYSCQRSERLYTGFLGLAIRRKNRELAADFLAHLTRMRWGRQRLEKIVDWYGRMYEVREWHGISHLIGRNIWKLPFAVACYFEPTFNPNGSRIESGIGPAMGPFLTLSVIPQEEGSVVALSYPAIFKEKLDPFLQTFRPPIDQVSFVERVWQTALLYCDNIVISPRYWAAVPETVHQAILEYSLQNPLIGHEPPDAAISLFDWINTMPRAFVAERLKLLEPTQDNTPSPN